MLAVKTECRGIPAPSDGDAVESTRPAYGITNEFVTAVGNNHGSGRLQNIHQGERKPLNLHRTTSKTVTQHKSPHKQRVDSEGKNYPCNVCDQSYSHKRSLLKHQRLCHANLKQYSCNSCDKTFSLKPRPIRATTKDTPFTCSTCCTTLTLYKKRERKTYEYTVKSSYACTICDMEFTYYHQLILHERVHTGEKPYKCNTCGKSFSQQGTLKTHNRIHTGKKSFICVTCSKPFRDQGSLTKHNLIHTGEKPYICRTCGKGFNRKPNLARHESSHTCADCGEFYSDIQKHRKQDKCTSPAEKLIRMKSAKKYACTLCEKSYTQKSKLTIHSTIHLK